MLLEKATLKKRPPYFSMVIGKCPGASGGSEPKPRLELFEMGPEIWIIFVAVGRLM